jgi:hypothetical protein
VRISRRGLGSYRNGIELAGAIVLKPWQQRDLRRTANTLIVRAGVSCEISEHCLGHVMPSIERTYNRYDYVNEKRDAFEKLATLVERIINPPEQTNVVSLRA